MSLQPQARTGRTRTDDGVDALQVWARLERSMGMELEPHSFLFGHPDCNRICLILALQDGDDVRYLQAVRPHCQQDKDFLGAILADFGGLVVSDRKPAEIIRRFLGVLLHKPIWVPRTLLYGLRRSWQERRHWGMVLKALLRLRLRVRPLAFVVHAFMDGDALHTDEAQERLDACVFKVPVGTEMVSMCQLNGTELRQNTYQSTSIKV